MGPWKTYLPTSGSGIVSIDLGAKKKSTCSSSSTLPGEHSCIWGIVADSCISRFFKMRTIPRHATEVSMHSDGDPCAAH